MKRLIALLLLCALLMALAGCQEHTNTSGVFRPPVSIIIKPTDATGDPTTPTEPEDPYYQVDYTNNRVIGGVLETLLASGGTVEVSFNDPYKGVPGSDYSSPHMYTFNDYLSSDKDLNWSPMNARTAEDAYVLEQTTMGLYAFTLNSDLTGWTVVPEMAAAAPEDVTADYVGRYGIGEGDSARAWRIALNPHACFSNGTAIDADTYVYSYQQLLDSRMNNARADRVCRGDFAIAGAADYYAGLGSWDAVGVLKTGQFELVLITAKAVTQPEFYVPYYLQDSFLVYGPLWESCKQYYDAAGQRLSGDCPEAVSVTSTYCTSVKTSVSYGPYVLKAYGKGESVLLERNFIWYGYMDALHLGQYQADEIFCRIISSYEDVLAAYEAGELDEITLQAADVEKYLESGLLRQDPQTYTTKLTFNTDAAALAARGNQVLANVYFRKAIALAIDRSRFSAAYTAPGLSSLGLINECYIGDMATGLVYRETAEADTVLRKLYGSELTGFDLDAARLLMQKAFAECLADGSYDGKAAITLRLSVYREDPAYSQIHAFLNQALEAATEGSGFAGKVSLELVVDENCYAAMARGETDLVFSTWGGNAFDPYSILYDCYCGDSRMEYGFDPAALTVEVEINGQVIAATLLDWARWCAGEKPRLDSDTGAALGAFADYDAQSRAAIFAQLEFAYLSQYVTTPLYSRGTPLLLSKKGNYALNNSMALVGFGGVRYYTFAYTDIQWAAGGAEE